MVLMSIFCFALACGCIILMIKNMQLAESILARDKLLIDLKKSNSKLIDQANTLHGELDLIHSDKLYRKKRFNETIEKAEQIINEAFDILEERD